MTQLSIEKTNNGLGTTLKPNALYLNLVNGSVDMYITDDQGTEAIKVQTGGEVVNLQYSKTISPNESTELTITNFDKNKTYIISANLGIVKFSKDIDLESYSTKTSDKITYIAPSEPNDDIITINGREFPIKVFSEVLDKPIIGSPASPFIFDKGFGLSNTHISVSEMVSNVPTSKLKTVELRILDKDDNTIYSNQYDALNEYFQIKDIDLSEIGLPTAVEASEFRLAVRLISTYDTVSEWSDDLLLQTLSDGIILYLTFDDNEIVKDYSGTGKVAELKSGAVVDTTYTLDYTNVLTLWDNGPDMKGYLTVAKHRDFSFNKADFFIQGFFMTGTSTEEAATIWSISNGPNNVSIRLDYEPSRATYTTTLTDTDSNRNITLSLPDNENYQSEFNLITVVRESGVLSIVDGDDRVISCSNNADIDLNFNSEFTLGCLNELGNKSRYTLGAMDKVVVGRNMYKYTLNDISVTSSYYYNVYSLVGQLIGQFATIAQAVNYYARYWNAGLDAGRITLVKTDVSYGPDTFYYDVTSSTLGTRNGVISAVQGQLQ